MKRSIRFGNVLFVLSLVALGLAGHANAGPLYWSGTGTWDDGATTNWGTAPGGPYTASAWVGGSDAHFEGTAGTATVSGAIASVNSINFDVTGYTIAGGTINNPAGQQMAITVAPGATGTISSDINISGVGSENSLALVMGGGGNLNLSGNVVANISLGTKGQVRWDGGGTLTVSGLLDNQYSGGNAQTDKIRVGETSANNTVDVPGRMLLGNSLFIGGATFGGNTMNVTGPGDYTTPTVDLRGNNIRLIIGASSSNNSLLVSAGAFLKFLKGNGTNYVAVGENAGADLNSLTITGTGAGYYDSGNLYVGKGGGNNTLTVSAGGSASPGRLFVGESGSNNSALITGAGSSLTPRVDHNTEFVAGFLAGASNNSITVQDGASAVVNGTRDTRNVGIGMADGANDNRVLIAGAGSSLTVTHVAPFVIGGSSTTDSTATGNHLDVYSGATASLRSVLLKGVDSAFNLGDGTGISEATVGQSSAAQAPVPGIVLVNSDSRLNFNSGRLIASLDGELVSGAGSVDLNGPAYIDTAGFTSSIDSVIAGAGSLTKEGAGWLTVSNANTYGGDTIVSQGTLSIGQNTGSGLTDLAAVKIALSAMMDLDFGTTTDTVGSLWLDGIDMGPGTYNATTHSSYFTGAGSLLVGSPGGGGEIPEPATMAMLAIAAAGLGGYVRRRRTA